MWRIMLEGYIEWIGCVWRCVWFGVCVWLFPFGRSEPGSFRCFFKRVEHLRAADYGKGAYLPSAHCMLLKDKIQLSFHVLSGHKGLNQQWPCLSSGL